MHSNDLASQRGGEFLFQLDKADYRTEIYAVQHASGCYQTTQHGEVPKGNADYLESVLVKSFASPLDRSTLTNAVSSWMFRTIGFLGRADHEFEAQIEVTSVLRGEAPGCREEMANRCDFTMIY